MEQRIENAQNADITIFNVAMNNKSRLPIFQSITHKKSKKPNNQLKNKVKPTFVQKVKEGSKKLNEFGVNLEQNPKVGEDFSTFQLKDFRMMTS